MFCFEICLLEFKLFSENNVTETFNCRYLKNSAWKRRKKKEAEAEAAAEEEAEEEGRGGGGRREKGRGGADSFSILELFLNYYCKQNSILKSLKE